MWVHWMRERRFVQVSPFAGPGGGVHPGLRPSEDPEHTLGHPPGYSPWTGFSPRDLDACYPMPAWVSERIRLYPQASQGSALHDPLPVPFTTDEVRRALQDVWLASRQRNDRRCAEVDPASVRIAMQVLPILVRRNGGWIDFSGRAYDPLVNTPGSNRKSGVNLQCLLYKLTGKPIAPILNPCNATPVPAWATLSVALLKTTFDGSRPAAPSLQDGASSSTPSLGWRGAPFARTTPNPIGSDFDLESAPSVPGLPLYGLVATFRPQG